MALFNTNEKFVDVILKFAAYKTILAFTARLLFITVRVFRPKGVKFVWR